MNILQLTANFKLFKLIHDFIFFKVETGQTFLLKCFNDYIKYFSRTEVKYSRGLLVRSFRDVVNGATHLLGECRLRLSFDFTDVFHRQIDPFILPRHRLSVSTHHCLSQCWSIKQRPNRKKGGEKKGNKSREKKYYHWRHVPTNNQSLYFLFNL